MVKLNFSECWLVKSATQIFKSFLMKTYQIFLVVSLFWYSILNAQTWQEIKRFSPEQTLHSIDFLDGQTGYTVGALYNNSNYNIHRTIDGGKTWIDQNSGYTGMRFMKI